MDYCVAAKDLSNRSRQGSMHAELFSYRKSPTTHRLIPGSQIGIAIDPADGRVLDIVSEARCRWCSSFTKQAELRNLECDNWRVQAGLGQKVFNRKIPEIVDGIASIETST